MIMGFNLYEYSLVFIVGILAGIATLVNETDDDMKFTLRKSFKVMYQSWYMTTIVYFILYAIDLDYYVRVGISSLIGFMGFDKAIEMFKKIMELRNGKN